MNEEQKKKLQEARARELHALTTGGGGRGSDTNDDSIETKGGKKKERGSSTNCDVKDKFYSHKPNSKNKT